MSEGRRRTEKVGPQPGRLSRAVPFLLGAVVAAAGWVLLVLVAVDQGRNAREGHGAIPWVLVAAATLGAVICLLLVLMLLARASAARRGVGWSRRTPGHRRV